MLLIEDDTPCAIFKLPTAGNQIVRVIDTDGAASIIDLEQVALILVSKPKLMPWSDNR